MASKIPIGNYGFSNTNKRKIDASLDDVGNINETSRTEEANMNKSDAKRMNVTSDPNRSVSNDENAKRNALSKFGL